MRQLCAGQLVDKRAAFLTNVEWRADNSPWTQVSIVGFLAFCSVGMFSAISNLGAGGTQDVQLSDIANSVLYGMFFLGGFFGGSINVREPSFSPCASRASWQLYLLT